MIIPNSIEELAGFVEQDGKKVFLFVADWCGDCRYIYPSLPEIEETNPEFDIYSSGPRPVHGSGQTLECVRNS